MRRMRKMAMAALAVALMPAAAPAEAPERRAEAACRKAEINPVTGHVFCLEPRGAPVEAPPEALRPDCKPDEARGQWSWGPACAPVPGER